MRIFAQRSHSLDAWLDAATRGLCDDALERVGEEIASHYEDALREAHGDGLAEDAAVARAVRSLGNPRRARKKLLQEHLTRLDAKKLERFFNAHALYMRNHGLTRIDYFARTFGCMGFVPLFAAAWLLQLYATFADASDAAEPSSAIVLVVFVALFVVFLAGQFLLFRWLGTRIGRKLYPDGLIPAWRAMQLEAIRTVALMTGLSLSFGQSFTSQYGIFAGRIETWGAFRWTFAAAISVLWLAMPCGVSSLFRLARKLRRLGYTDPPSASC